MHFSRVSSSIHPRHPTPTGNVPGNIEGREQAAGHLQLRQRLIQLDGIGGTLGGGQRVPRAALPAKLLWAQVVGGLARGVVSVAHFARHALQAGTRWLRKEEGAELWANIPHASLGRRHPWASSVYGQQRVSPKPKTCLPLEEDARGVAAAGLDGHVFQLGHAGGEGKGHRAAGESNRGGKMGTVGGALAGVAQAAELGQVHSRQPTAAQQSTAAQHSTAQHGAEQHSVLTVPPRW